MAGVVMILLSVGSPLAIPMSYRNEGEPLSLMCVGVFAVAALRRRTRRPREDAELP